MSNSENHYSDANELTPHLGRVLSTHSQIQVPLIPTGIPHDTNPKFVSKVIFEPASQMMAFTLLNEDFGRKLRLELNITDDSITVALMVNPERMNPSANEGISGDYHYARW
ncbi:hypothetical protein BJ508DRAFT_331092 [Ascobolus immersus RN42]|uniref:Uncharacterized protein n=1 Tax=Ascobolus immersus RN42 TaxID=1160509 RepID=A0A3N4HS57_ASCIM|nr:hypothetical protein BJ508DRAFT_331092 [Ascobolus immersus RN42]